MCIKTACLEPVGCVGGPTVYGTHASQYRLNLVVLRMKGTISAEVLHVLVAFERPAPLGTLALCCCMSAHGAAYGTALDRSA